MQSIIHPHQRCGYSDSPFARKDTFLYCRVLNWVGGSGGAVGEQVDPKKKKHIFVIEKYVEDVKQDQKTVPDLVESITRATDPVKEELRRILFKMKQYRPEIIKIRASTFWISGKIPDSR